jgi:HEPN domain-containing protein
MGRVVLTAPDPSIGIEFIAEARELFALGYHRPAAIMARLSIEAAVVKRLEPTEEQPERKSFANLVKRLRKGCTLNSSNGHSIDRAYRRLSKFAHVDYTPRDAADVPSLIDLAETFRQLVATTEATYEAVAALEVQNV